MIVSDNGVGIPAENLERVFSHGFTTRKDGHGFGLHSAPWPPGKWAARSPCTATGPARGRSSRSNCRGRRWRTRPRSPWQPQQLRRARKDRGGKSHRPLELVIPLQGIADLPQAPPGADASKPASSPACARTGTGKSLPWTIRSTTPGRRQPRIRWQRFGRLNAAVSP